MVIRTWAAAVLISAACAVPALAEEDMSIGQIERTQELIDREEELRKQVEHAPLVVPKEIRVAGATELSEQEIRDIVSPYEGLPLTEGEISEMTDGIVEAYRGKGYGGKDVAVTYKISGKVLTFIVQESKK